ncbi:MAG TPA: Smr/MutS family protein [Candidatus Eisenbacteria bacterium]|nr:Smr/MutS family protein [Candidatus Eisenbacteria bacterium]
MMRSTPGEARGEDALERIEFGAIRAWLAARTSSERARRMAAALAPADDLAQARERLADLAEAKRLFETHGAWPAPAASELGEAWEAARRGQRLDALVLLEVRRLLDAVESTRAYFLRVEDAPRVRAQGEALVPAAELLRSLRQAIDPQGEITDAASPALARLRSRRADTRQRLIERLERLAAKEKIDGSESEGFVTQRDGRYVVPVRADRFDRSKGVVHDASRTGAVLFVEPFSVLPANNELRELEVQEAQEIGRILDALTARVGERADVLARDEEILAELDVLSARVRLSREMAGTTPRLLEGAEGRLRLIEARHPLLWRQNGGASDAERARTRVVPFDLTLEGRARVLLVSGPNMGGKTVLLKAVGLAVTMAAAGLDVCAAEGSTLPFVRELYADIGDAQSIADQLSTFAGRLGRMDAMARAASPNVLCLLDEIGSGTDPDEGAALAQALLERLGERGAWTVATTHLGSLKAIAGERPEVVNGSMEMDAQRLEPRFRLLVGVPGGSYGLVTARRLGLDQPVLARAEALAGEEGRSLAGLVSELTEQLARARVEREETRRALDQAAARLAELDRLESEQEQRVAERQRRRLEEIRALESQARGLLREVRREAERAPAEREANRLRALGDQVREVAHTGDRLAAATRPRESDDAPTSLEPGTSVRHAGLGIVARIVEGPDAEGQVLLARGAWRIRAAVADLRRTEGDAAPGGEESGPRRDPLVTVDVANDAAWEVDVRGMPAEEAVDAVDRALDRAVLAGHRELRVIHGIGKGVLRDVLARHLRGHPQVAAEHLGHVGEGGRGVTVAELR